MQNDINNLELKIDYIFNDKALLIKSLTHPSYANEHGTDKNDNNQRLEFLGDAVLEMIITDKLYQDYAKEDEGLLTNRRANIVCEEYLSKVATDIELYKYILHSNGMTEEDIKSNKNILCDTVESLIAGIYLDGGYEYAKEFILDKIYYKFEGMKTNYKSILREYCNKERIELSYKLIRDFGPAHKKSFEIACLLNDKEYNSAIGLSKKTAEQEAAKIVINELNIKGNI